MGFTKSLWDQKAVKQVFETNSDLSCHQRKSAANIASTSPSVGAKKKLAALFFGNCFFAKVLHRELFLGEIWSWTLHPVSFFWPCSKFKIFEAKKFLGIFQGNFFWAKKLKLICIRKFIQR